jgi:23S rRNA (adenine2503-C2)-methyltransferase
MDLKRVERRFAELGQPAYRARQVWEWTARGAAGYDAMTNLPRSLRDALSKEVPFSTLGVEEEQHARDGTVKTLFRTADGHPVEAVLMRYRDGRRSVCVSSQSGCPLTCTFCATGRMAFGRNLTSWEILDQVLHFVRLERTSRSRAVARGAGPEGTVLQHGPGRPGAASGGRGGGAGLRPAGAAPAGGVTHLVFMGMGEPFMNVDAVLEAARRLPDIGITHRRTTISTVGWMPGLQRFVDGVSEPIRLALSLHAADPELRSELMPVNDRYPLPDVLELCRRHWERTRRRVFVEYVMLSGVNDSPAQARLLAKLLGREAFKVNLIPYNPTGNSHKGHRLVGSSRDAIAAFKAELDRAHVPATVRLTRGRDIAAACGQLATAPRPRSGAAAGQ